MTTKTRKILIIALVIYISICILTMLGFMFIKNTRNADEHSEAITTDNSYDTTLKVVMDIDNAPFSYYDEDGHFTGLDVEIIKIICSKIYVNAEIIPVTLDEAIEMVNSGEADVLTSYSPYNNLDIDNIVATVPVYNNPYCLFGDRNLRMGDFDIYKSKLAAVNGTQTSYIKDYNLNSRTTYKDTTSDLFDLYKNGDVDYLIMRQISGQFALSKAGISGVSVLDTLDGGRVSIAINADKEEYVQKINKVLESMVKDNTLAGLKDKWIPDRFLYSSFLFAGAGVNIFYWAFSTSLTAIIILLVLVLLAYRSEQKMQASLKQAEIYKDSINQSANGYFEVNLTKDLVVSNIMEMVNKEYVDIFDRLNIPKPIRYSEFIEFISNNRLLSDRDDFTRNLNRLNLIRENSEGIKIHEINFRAYMVEGSKKWLNMMVFTSKPSKKSDVNAIFVMQDVTEEYANREKQRLRDSALLGMSSDFDLVSYVNLSTGDENVYHSSPLFLEIFGKQKKYSKFTEKMNTISGELVLESERDRFLHDTVVSTILDELNENGSYTVHTILQIKGKPLYYEVKYVLDKENDNGFIFGIRDVDDEIRRELNIQKDMLQRNNIINILASEYSSVFYIDPETGYTIPYQIADKYKEDLEGYLAGSKTQFFTLFDHFANTYICEDDRAEVLEKFSHQSLLEALQNKKSFSYVYRIIDEYGDLRFNEVKAVKIDKESESPTGIAIAFADRDEEILNKYIRDKMVEEYDSLYIVDLEHNTFRTIKSSDTFDADALSGGNFSKAMRLYSYQLRSEYIEVWSALANPKNLQQYLENEDRREFLYRIPSVINSWRRAIIQVVERKDGVATELVVSFMGIDAARAEMLDMGTQAEAQKKELEEKQAILEEARSSAEQASAAKSSFLFNMSHDIRTPMNAIQGFTTIAKKNMADSAKVAECLDKIEVSSKHLLDLINDVLDMARIESGKVTLEESRTDLRKENTEIVTMVKEMAKAKDIEMELEFKDFKNDEVLSDPLRLNQIFINLLSNAVKYTNPGGNVWYIITQKECDEEGFAKYEFVVKDNGIGMSEDYVNTIFEAFTREKNSTTSGIQGTGLGMAITKQLLDLMDGEIRIDTKLGEGTTVIVDIKFKLADYSFANMEGAREEEEALEIDLKDRRVLLVEDNEFNREIARDILEDEGVIVEEADDGTVAVDMVSKADVGYYDFVLMDVQMPTMDGYEATRRIRAFEDEEKASVPIIAMTANAFDEDKARAKEAGMNAFVSKPINIVVLLQTLQSFINKKNRRKKKAGS